MANFYNAFFKYLFNIYFVPDTGPNSGNKKRNKEQVSIANK